MKNILAIIIVLAAPATAAAQFHSNVLLGGRTASMGGAATAAGTDAAMPILNPAGLAGLPADVLSLSASAYQYESITSPNLFHPNGTAGEYGDPVTTDGHVFARTLSVYPTSLLYAMHFETDHLIAFSIATPRRSDRQIEGESKTSFENGVRGPLQDHTTFRIVREASDFNFGASYALRLSPRIRAGATLLGIYTREHDVDIMDHRVTAESIYGWAVQSHSDEHREHWAIQPVAGVQMQLLDELWIGAAIALPSLSISGRASAELQAGQSTTLDGDTATVRQEADLTYDRPLRLNAGLEYRPIDSLAVALDATIYAPRGDAVHEVGVNENFLIGANERIREYRTTHDLATSYDTAWSFALGVDLLVSDALSARGGIFAQSSNVAEAELVDVADENLLLPYGEPSGMLFGACLGAGLRTGAFETTVAGVYRHTIEQRESPDVWSAEVSHDATVIEETSDSFAVIVSTAITIGGEK